MTYVPEAATQVYQSLGTRWDLQDVSGRREIQRRIYRLQLQQETELAAANPGKALLLDRGSVDGSAYWPDGPDSYWHELGTTADSELNRYDAVIWLESCAVLGVYDGSASNPCRHEDAAGAIATGRRLHAVWQAHRRFHSVPAYPDLEQKIVAVRAILDAFLPDRGS